MTNPATTWLENQIAKLDDRLLARELGYLIDAYAASQARVRELETGWIEWNGRRIPLPEYAASIRQRDQLREDGDE